MLVTWLWIHSETCTTHNNGTFLHQEVLPSSLDSQTPARRLLKGTQVGSVNSNFAYANHIVIFHSLHLGPEGTEQGQGFDNQIQLWVRAPSMPECLLSPTDFQTHPILTASFISESIYKPTYFLWIF